MTRRRVICLAALVLTALTLWLLPRVHTQSPAALSGKGNERTLLRVWSVSSVGGGESWLKARLRAFEKANPGVMTYLRTVTPEALYEENAVLPDVVLYTPGALTEPEALLLPIGNVSGIREPLLRCGRWKGEQYGLPLCYGAYVLAIDSAIEPHEAATPAPTTLLGRPAATSPVLDTTPAPYPLEAALKAETPLLASPGCGLFALSCLLPQDQRPPLPDQLSTLTSAEVYRRFQARQSPTCLLTTGQITAQNALVASGKAFAFRTMAPSEIVTDLVWLGSVVKGGSDQAAALLAFLTAQESQEALSSQGLHTVREGLRLYYTGVEHEVEAAADHALAAINAYLPPEQTFSAAWQVYQGQTGLGNALLPLL